MHGKMVRAMQESYPARCGQDSRWYHVYPALGQLRREGVDFEPCAMSTRFYALPNWILLGRVPMSDEDEINTEWTTTELEKSGLPDNFAGGLKETGTRTPAPEDAENAEQDMDKGDQGMHPAAQAAASGRDRGGGRKGKGAPAEQNKHFNSGPDVAT